MRLGRHTLRVLLVFILAAECAEAIDFRLREHRVANLDGDSIDFYFKHEESRIFYRLPRSWTYEGSESEFVARPPLPSRGRLVIQAMRPFPKLPSPGTQEGIEAYRQHFVEHFPAGAANLQELQTEVMKLGGRELPATCSTFEYSWNGRARGYTVVYAALRADLWLVIRIDSLKEDFASVRAKALASLEGFTEQAPQPRTITASN